MPHPPAFLFRNHLSIAIFAGSRLATATGLAVVWHRLRHTPGRVRRFLVWVVAHSFEVCPDGRNLLGV